MHPFCSKTFYKTYIAIKFRGCWKSSIIVLMTRSCVHHFASSSTRCPDQHMFPGGKMVRLVFWCICVCEDWANMHTLLVFPLQIREDSSTWRLKTSELNPTGNAMSETGATNSQTIWFRLITWLLSNAEAVQAKLVGSELNIFQQICLHLLLRSGFSVAVQSVLARREVTTGISNNHTECKNILSSSWNLRHCRANTLGP